MTQNSTVPVIGGTMAGLAAAEGFHDAGFDVPLYESRSYTNKRGNCGETVTAVLLGATVQAGSGLDIEELNRTPRIVLVHLAQHPILFGKIFLRSGDLRRIYAAMTDQWEFASREFAGHDSPTQVTHP